jgi:hypothetical protein
MSIGGGGSDPTGGDSGGGSGGLFSFANSLNSITESAAKAERALTHMSPNLHESNLRAATTEPGEAGDQGTHELCEPSPMNVTGM